MTDAVKDRRLGTRPSHPHQPEGGTPFQSLTDYLASEADSEPARSISEGQFTSFQNVAYDFSDVGFFQPTRTVRDWW